jgi:hypothetical protein
MLLPRADTSAPSPAAEPSRIGPQQFSLRSLFVLTLVVAIYLTISVLSQDSPYLQVFSSPWTALSLLPIASLWLCHRWNLLTTGRLVAGSFVAYLIALALPALHFEDDVSFGWFYGAKAFSLAPANYMRNCTICSLKILRLPPATRSRCGSSARSRYRRSFPSSAPSALSPT